MCVGCAGPTNPFGSKVWINSEFKKIPSESETRELANVSAQVKSFPQTKLYHTPYDLIVQITDEAGVPKDFRYQVVYNGDVLENWWKTEKIVFDDHNPHIVNIVFKNLSLLAERENDIKILYYRSAAALPVVYSLAPPKCSMDEILKIDSLGPFEHSAPLAKNEIEQIAIDNNVNPTLIAALIAQESSFDPKAISWAKAVGLTQVTPIANKEIIGEKAQWPVDNRINEMNYMQIKARIFMNKINAQTDWRLDKAKSLEGGILFIKKLKNYWSQKSSVRLLKSVFKQNIPWTDIILASYNSGAYRVKKSIKRNRKQWLQDHELKEAKKYVRNIRSYCYAFSDLERVEPPYNSKNKIVKK
tara:strand:+ start:60272 stop:61345 length:1074 start_codon:yes stop_codon:yes gene_type:complete